ncbi:Non-heme 11 kDa protein of cytochrome bc1 complex [Lactarius psammicola]|nr:Non-heme 11 kDa protein of cytochrome bc1 complex [Lactarius psammicola]
MSLSSFFSSFVGTLHADAPEESKVSEAEPQEVEEVAVEEEDPEDIHPQLREEAQESSKCKAAAQHFFHCQEKVQSGKGFKHEDCVEEIMMHCTDNELAPKLFAKLR